jgi:uncharacterized membrane protein YtjA (UPF0391 family)
MLRDALIYLILGIVAAFFGFGDLLSPEKAALARFLFWTLIILSFFAFIFGIDARRRSKR